MLDHLPFGSTIIGWECIQWFGTCRDISSVVTSWRNSERGMPHGLSGRGWVGKNALSAEELSAQQDVPPDPSGRGNHRPDWSPTGSRCSQCPISRRVALRPSLRCPQLWAGAPARGSMSRRKLAPRRGGVRYNQAVATTPGSADTTPQIMPAVQRIGLRQLGEGKMRLGGEAHWPSRNATPRKPHRPVSGCPGPKLRAWHARDEPRRRLSPDAAGRRTSRETVLRRYSRDRPFALMPLYPTLRCRRPRPRRSVQWF